jgi:hypothetical protein
LTSGSCRTTIDMAISVVMVVSELSSYSELAYLSKPTIYVTDT